MAAEIETAIHQASLSKPSTKNRTGYFNWVFYKKFKAWY